MLDLGWQEFFLIATIAVVVVGPKDLPKVIRTVVGWIRKVRSMARDFQGSIEEVAREAELDEIRKEAAKLQGGDLKQSILDTVDPDRELSTSLKEAKADIEADAQAMADASENSMLDPNAGTHSDTAPTAEAEEPALIDEEPLKGWDADSVTTPANSITPPATENAAATEQSAEKPARKPARKTPSNPRSTKVAAEEAGAPAKSSRKAPARKTGAKTTGKKLATRKTATKAAAVTKTAGGSKPRKPRAAAKPKTAEAQATETPATET